MDAFLYWETVENTPKASSANVTFNNYSIAGQQIGNDIPNYKDGQLAGTLRAYKASVNAYLPDGANGVRFATGTYTVALPDGGGAALPLTEGASLVMVYRVLSPNFPLKSVVLYDGAALPAASNFSSVQVMQGFYDAAGGGNATGKSTNLFVVNGAWNDSVTTVSIPQPTQYNAPLTPGSAYAAVILSTPVNNSDNDGILDAWEGGSRSRRLPRGPTWLLRHKNSDVGRPAGREARPEGPLCPVGLHVRRDPCKRLLRSNEGKSLPLA